MTASLLVVCGFIYIIQPFQKDAVDKGFAIWEVTNNATGQTKFQWVDYSAAERLKEMIKEAGSTEHEDTADRALDKLKYT